MMNFTNSYLHLIDVRSQPLSMHKRLSDALRISDNLNGVLSNSEIFLHVNKRKTSSIYTMIFVCLVICCQCASSFKWICSTNNFKANHHVDQRTYINKLSDVYVYHSNKQRNYNSIWVTFLFFCSHRIVFCFCNISAYCWKVLSIA